MLFCSFRFELPSTHFNFMARYVCVDWCGWMLGTWWAHTSHYSLHAFLEYQLQCDLTPPPTLRHMHALVKVKIQIQYSFNCKRSWMHRQRSWGHSRHMSKQWRHQARWFPPVALGLGALKVKHRVVLGWQKYVATCACRHHEQAGTTIWWTQASMQLMHN